MGQKHQGRKALKSRVHDGWRGQIFWFLDLAGEFP